VKALFYLRRKWEAKYTGRWPPSRFLSEPTGTGTCDMRGGRGSRARERAPPPPLHLHCTCVRAAGDRLLSKTKFHRTSLEFCPSCPVYVFKFEVDEFRCLSVRFTVSRSRVPADSPRSAVQLGKK
jgi:hypothetical protein